MHLSDIKKLPSNPGVYQFFDKEDKIIYVGKAKNLKRRISSYFLKTHDNKKTEVLVRQIEKIRHIVVDNEEDALLLENNLIKQYQPKYNILLKDDKTFPWICIKNEPFPRIFYTRKKIKDGSTYFGPYTSVYMARTILEVIKQLFQIRNCNFTLSEANIVGKKFRKCLEFQIGNCNAPCELLYSKKDYDIDIQNAKAILSGTITPVYNYLKEAMQAASEKYDFEHANEFKSKIQVLDNYRSKSLVCSASMTNMDVFSYHEDDKNAFVNYFRIVDGSIVTSYLLEVKKKLNESKDEILSFCIVEIRKICNSESTEIILPFLIDVVFSNLKITVPQKGEKKKILELCEKNGRLFMLERAKNNSAKSPVLKKHRILERMQKDLKLNVLPRLIECFDNSNISGDYPVSSCVVFKDGLPLKSQYRHFNVKSVEGPNDFATMQEVVERRYRRQLDEGNQLPDLILIDGGKGQLSAAYAVLTNLGLEQRIHLIGIAKRLEELYFPNDPIPIYLDKKSETLKVLQYLRDEAHRFGITFHRLKRSENFTDSELSAIPGIGTMTTEKLLTHFKSVIKIKSALFSEIEKMIGKDKARKVLDYYANSEVSKK
ncbi:MAG: excinuclease ABC subunit UvrC [Prolixibacteraceae bacterium]|jgi:excinuclease ABC subunit C|nr:excinuclease ABC subunit UvrC [Prolixibacteraceae bacterium]